MGGHKDYLIKILEAIDTQLPDYQKLSWIRSLVQEALSKEIDDEQVDTIAEKAQLTDEDVDILTNWVLQEKAKLERGS